MSFKTLTRQTWNDDLPRLKLGIGPITIFAAVFDPAELTEAEGTPLEPPMRVELDMMALAGSVGVRVPKVYAYDRQGRVETCVMEYVQGEMLESIADQAVISKARTKVRSYVDMMQTIRRTSVDFVLKNNLYFRGDSFPSSEAFYRHMLKYIIVLHAMKFPEAPTPSYDIDAALAAYPVNEPAVFSHGDLYNLNNVIVADGGDTITLIDFECAGYLPLHVARWFAGVDGDTPAEKLVRHLGVAYRGAYLAFEDQYCQGVQDLLAALNDAGAYIYKDWSGETAELAARAKAQRAQLAQVLGGEEEQEQKQADAKEPQ